jgi:hypothetical protein
LQGVFPTGPTPIFTEVPEEYRKFWESSLDRLAAYLEGTAETGGKKGEA